MNRFRLLLFAIVMVATVILAYLLRDVVYQLVVVPLAYTFWLARLAYEALPQLLKWVVLLVVLTIAIVWRLIPDLPTPAKPRLERRGIEGRVQSLAISIHRARNSNYFKWQLANRLARLARRISDTSNRTENGQADDAVHQYLAAGLNQSFVDFPAPRNRFVRRPSTSLDVDPGEIVAYLESRMELTHDGRTRSR